MKEDNENWFTEDEEREFCEQICDKLGQGLPKHALLEQGLIDYCGCETDEDYEFDEEFDEEDDWGYSWEEEL